MTDTAQEQHIEDVVADLDDGSLLISVANGRASMSTQMWNRMVEEIARLRAPQREEGDDPPKSVHWCDGRFRPGASVFCSRHRGTRGEAGNYVRADLADDPQREDGGEALSLAQLNALDQYSRVVKIVSERMPMDATFDPASVAAHLRQLLEPDDQQDSIFAEIRAERARQDAKWGRSFPDRDWDRWVTILTEEVGEFSEAVLELPYDGSEEEVRQELVQIAAVAVAALVFGAPQGSQRGVGGDGIREEG